MCLCEGCQERERQRELRRVLLTDFFFHMWLQWELDPEGVPRFLKCNQAEITDSVSLLIVFPIVYRIGKCSSGQASRCL